LVSGAPAEFQARVGKHFVILTYLKILVIVGFCNDYICIRQVAQTFTGTMYENHKSIPNREPIFTSY